MSEIYNWFTEGFDTRDLKDAKGLLDEFSNQSSPLNATRSALSHPSQYGSAKLANRDFDDDLRLNITRLRPAAGS